MKNVISFENSALCHISSAAWEITIIETFTNTSERQSYKHRIISF